MLVVAMVCWEVTLSKGQEWDWFGDPFGRVQTLVFLFVTALGILVFWELRRKSPVVNFRPLTERNFVISSIIIFCAYAVLYGASTSLPALLQTLFGYDALQSGLVMSPGGILSVITLPIVGYLLGRQFDARWMIAIGLGILGLGSYWMSLMNLQISPIYIILPRVVMIFGLSLIFAPLNVAAYRYMPLALRGAAVGMFSLLRNEGGSVGTSVAQVVQERRVQFHALRLGEFLDPFSPAASSFVQQTQNYFLGQTGDPVAAKAMSTQALANLRDSQALALSYFDCFWLFAVIAFALVFLVPFMKRSVTEKGEHVGGE
jgi:DHA2 family multidrug resistance protein